MVRGGFGIYNNWLTQANVQEEFRGSPPGEVNPTFFGSAALFNLGTSSKPPFGFSFPTFQGGLNAQGGVVGTSFSIGGINPLLKSPKADIWSLSVERKLGNNFAASVGYNGSHSYDIVANGNGIGIVSYGVDINVVPGDLIQHESTTPTRLNPSFGSITYSDNNRYGNYDAIYFDLKGRFSRGYIDASYTRARSKDDALAYPSPFNPAQYYGPSIFDVPNRFSLSFNYSLKGLNGGAGLVGHITDGWGVSGTSILQSGYPMTAFNSNSYQPICANTSAPCPSLANPAVGYAAGSGDYNADGDSQINNVGLDYPNALSYHQSTNNKDWLTGAVPKSDFAVPALGQEGNEKSNGFRGPNFIETNINFYKDTHITERVNFQFRFEIFNLFNRPNYVDNNGNTGVDMNFPDGNFGRATQSHEPRFWQLGGKISF